MRKTWISFALAACVLTTGCGDAADETSPDAAEVTTPAAAVPTDAPPETVDPAPSPEASTADDESTSAPPTTTTTAEDPAVTDDGPDVDPDDDTGDPTTGPGTLAEPDTASGTRARPTPPAPTLSEGLVAALDAARALSDSGDRMGAVRALRDAEKTIGKHGALRLEAGRCFFEIAKEGFVRGDDAFLVKSHLADAHLRVDQAMALHADLPGAAVLLASILRYEENPEGARDLLAAHLETWSGDAPAHALLGEMASNARDWETADTHWTLAASINPEDGLARLNATISKQWLGATGVKRLHAGYREAARLLPEVHRPVDLLAKLYPRSATGQLAAMDEIIADTPTAIWARVWKSFIYRSGVANDLDAAIAVLDEALVIAPADPSLHFNRGQILFELDQRQPAIDAYIRAIEVGETGTMVGASNALDQLLHIGPDSRIIPIEVRDRAYDAIIAGNPTAGAYGNNAGLWYRDIGRDYEKSLKYYQASVDAQPDDQDFINDTALIYLFHLRDRKEVSLPMFEKVLRLVEENGQDPIRGYWDALENLCKYYYEIGQYDRVVEMANKRANPDAMVNGRAYPSMKAAQWKRQAEAKLK